MLSLRSKITLLSVFSSLFVVTVIYVTIIYTYTREIYSDVDRNLIKETSNVINLLKFDQYAKLDLTQKQVPIQVKSSKQPRYGYLVRDINLNILRRSIDLISIELEEPDILSKNKDSFATIVFNHAKFRAYNSLYNKQATLGRELYVIQVLISYDFATNKIAELNKVLLWSIPLPLLLISLAAWWIATNALKPVRALVTTIKNIDASELDLRTRLDSNSNDEIGEISTAFNEMLDRINATFDSLTRFTADASHELRTPLTSIRTQAEVILSKKRTASEYKDTISTILEDLLRIEQLVSVLLELARGDAGLIQYNFKSTNISDLTRQWVEHFTPLAEERKIKLEEEIADHLFANVDQTLFERILINLIENAIEYSPVKTVIIVSLGYRDDMIELKIIDQGLGLTDSEKQKIFERFVRLDKTRHKFKGSGLGLAIVKWAIDAHQGIIQVFDNMPMGAIFVVKIPIKRPDKRSDKRS